MSFLTKLAETYGKRPVWLVEITRGTTTWRWTMGASDYGYGGEVFAASSLWCDELNYSSEVRKDDFTLQGFPLSDAATQALIEPAEEITTLTLRRGFVGDSEFVVSINNAVKTHHTHQNKSVSLVFSTYAHDLNKRSAGFVAGRQCPWRLYDDNCGLNRPAFEEDGTCTSIIDGVADVNEASAHANGYYTGGIISFDGVRRMIVRHQGSELTLATPFPALAAAVPAAVQIAPGCDKSLQTCLNRFDNIRRYGGFPQMTDNPFQRRVF